MATSTADIGTPALRTAVDASSVTALSTASPASSAASSSGGEEGGKTTSGTALLVPVTSGREVDDGETDDDPVATGNGANGLAGAFGMMKDRAATASKTLGPQLLLMKDKTSKQ